jgi:site-specific DNA recombinase
LPFGVTETCAPGRCRADGLIICGHCGCAVVGEIKKERYVYYHCTGYKQKCGEPYVREEVIAEKFSAILGRLRFSEQIHDAIVTGLRQSLGDERCEHDAAISRLQAEYDRIGKRVSVMYLDRVDGRINADTYDKLLGDWRQEQERCLQEIRRHQSAEESYMEEGTLLLTVAREAQQMFDKRDAEAKRRLLNFVVSNSILQNGELTANFRQPFNLIAEISSSDPDGDDDGGGNPHGRLVWWVRQDSTLQPDRYEREDIDQLR